jgi:hypothetical protein
VEDARASQHKVRRAAARQGSDAWDLRKQEVALESLRWRAVVKRGSGRRRATWRGRERQREAGKRRGRGWGDTWMGTEQRWGGRGGANGQGSGGGARQRKTEERGREVDEGGPGCNFEKRQGLHCNA